MPAGRGTPRGAWPSPCPHPVGRSSGRAARTAVAARSQGRLRETPCREPRWPWWLQEDDREWLRWQLRLVAHRLLAEAVEGLAYHLASWSWPDQASAITIT